MPVRLRLAAPLAGVALLVASSAAAQAPTDTVRLADVVVTATRTELPRRAVPASVTVITGAELRNRGIRFVLDWLREVPGVALAQNGSFGAVASLFLRGGESDYTRILVDGVAVNTPGGAVNLAHLSTDNVERIEVLRGPASVLYGSDAVSGVIHVITRRGTGPGRVDVTLRGGTLGTSDLSAGWSGGAEHSAWGVGLARYETSGIYPFNNRYLALTGSGRLAVRPDDRTDLALAARWGDYRAHFPTDFSGAPSDSNQFTTDRTLALSLDAGRRIGPRTMLRALASAFEGDGGYDNPRDHAGDTLGFGFEATRTARVARRALDLRVIAQASATLHLTAGAELSAESERLSSRTTSNFGGGGTTSSDAFDHARRNAALYAQTIWGAASAVDVHAGVRVDENEVFGGFLTGRAGVVLRPGAGFRLHAAAGTAFKAPTFSEQFADTPFEVGDPGLAPERAVSWEAGVEGTLARGRVVLTATWFEQRFRDMIQYGSAGPGEPTYANVARASARGVEAAAAWRPLERLALRAHWTGLRTRVEEAGTEPGVSFAPGARLLRRPSGTVAADVAWMAPGGARLGVGLVRTGARDDVDFAAFPAERVRLPGFTVVNLSATVPTGGTISLTASVRNLLDTDYESVVGFRGIGRVVLVGARLGR